MLSKEELFGPAVRATTDSELWRRAPGLDSDDADNSENNPYCAQRGIVEGADR